MTITTTSGFMCNSYKRILIWRKEQAARRGTSRRTRSQAAQSLPVPVAARATRATEVENLALTGESVMRVTLSFVSAHMMLRCVSGQEALGEEEKGTDQDGQVRQEEQEDEGAGGGGWRDRMRWTRTSSSSRRRRGEEEEEGPSFKIDDIVVTLLELVHHHAAWDTDAGGLRMLGERGVQIPVGSIGMDFRVGGLRRLVLEPDGDLWVAFGEVPIRCRPSDVCLFEASLEGI
jgi:hypothetical protein